MNVSFNNKRIINFSNLQEILHSIKRELYERTVCILFLCHNFSWKAPTQTDLTKLLEFDFGDISIY